MLRGESPRPPRHLHLRPRATRAGRRWRPTSCSSTPATPTGCGSPHGRRTARPTPIRVHRAHADARRRDADAINRVYVRCGMVPAPTDVIWDNHRTRRGRLPGRRATTTTAASSAPSPASTTSGCSPIPENGSSLWTLAVDPATSLPGVGAALTRALADDLPRPRPGLPGSVGDARQRGRHRAVREAGLRTGPGAGGQAQERDQRAAVHPRRPKRSTTSTRTRGSSPTRRCGAASGSRCPTPETGEMRLSHGGRSVHHPGVAVGVHLRGGDEPLRRQAPDPADRQRGRHRGAARPAGHLRRRRPRVPRRGGRRRGEADARRAGQGHHRRRGRHATNSTRRWPGPANSIPTCSSSSARPATTCGWW